MWDTIAMVCAVTVPVFNIPLIARIIKRRSSADISLLWAAGVWVCFVGMFPSNINSADKVMRVFSVANLVFFSIVFAVVLAYHPLVRRRKMGTETPKA